MKEKYRIKETVYKNKCVFMPQYTYFSIIWNNWYRWTEIDLVYDNIKEAEEFIQKKCNKNVIATYYHKIKCEE